MSPSREKPSLALFDLTGKTALITGAAGGIGAVLARGLAGAGARVGNWPGVTVDLLAARIVLGTDMTDMMIRVSNSLSQVPSGPETSSGS